MKCEKTGAQEHPVIGQVFGHCRVQAKIGEGGMGVVYRAYDEVLQRDVAVKVVKKDARLGPPEVRISSTKRAPHLPSRIPTSVPSTTSAKPKANSTSSWSSSKASLSMTCAETLDCRRK